VFNGFSPTTITFLLGLKTNNNKAWFLAHEDEYRQTLLEPMRDLVCALAETMLDIDSEFETSPTVNKTISRIYRDTRFSRDKSMFRSNMWISFKRPGPGWQDEPGYFFEIAHDRYCYGMGLYKPDRKTMDAFRARWERKPDEFRRAIAFLEDAPHLTLEGDQYQRVVNPAIPADLQSRSQRKLFYLFCSREIDDRLFRSEFADEVGKEFQRMAPLYHYIWRVKGKS